MNFIIWCRWPNNNVEAKEGFLGKEGHLFPVTEGGHSG